MLFCTVIVVAVASLITWSSTPQYSSSSRVFISTSASSDTSAQTNAHQGGLAATQRVQSYAALVSDGELATRVVNALDVTPTELTRQINAEVVPETVLLQVQVTDPSTTRAQVICREVVGPATPASSPVTPQPLRNLLFGLLLGLLFGVAAAVVREFLDKPVKSGREIEDIIHAPLLGGIANDPEAVRTPLITSLSSHAPRAESFRVLRTNLQFVDVDSSSQVFVVTSSMPGEGKSTTAVNVAITMAQAGQRVLLVDCDLRRPPIATSDGPATGVAVLSITKAKRRAGKGKASEPVTDAATVDAAAVDDPDLDDTGTPTTPGRHRG